MHTKNVKDNNFLFLFYFIIIIFLLLLPAIRSSLNAYMDTLISGELYLQPPWQNLIWTLIQTLYNLRISVSGHSRKAANDTFKGCNLDFSVVSKLPEADTPKE